MKNKILGVIPARFGSTRFPGKPLALINGVPLIVRVYNGAKSSAFLDELVVATDDQKIRTECISKDINVIMTGDCTSGSDRVYKVAEQINADIYVNIQGDEPLIDGKIIDEAIRLFESDIQIQVATLIKEIKNDGELKNPNVVKVVADNDKNALYFSRLPIPFKRGNCDIKYYKHIGLYVYRKEALKKFSSLSKGILENVECLEQLRFLENGIKIRLIETQYEAIGVDTPEDIKKVENVLNNLNPGNL